MAEDFEFQDENKPDDLFEDPLGEDRRPEEERSLEEREVKVVGVYQHDDPGGAQDKTFFVLLRDTKERSVLIWIGRFEAMAISLAIEGASADRPLTHDLLNNIVAKMGGSVERILIDDLWNDTYYAKISIVYDGKALEIDSRPSDAVALALRAKAPIFMVEDVLERAKVHEE